MAFFIFAVLLACLPLATSESFDLYQRHAGQNFTSARSIGQSVIVNDVAYYIPAKAEISFKAPKTIAIEQEHTGFLPITLLQLAKPHLSRPEFETSIGRFAANDDVWSAAFSKFTIVQAPMTCHVNISKQISSFTAYVNSTELANLPQGPYFLSIGQESWQLYRAFRLYNDYNFSFYYGIFDDGDGCFHTLPVTHPWTDGSATIAVPSRLYYPAPTAAKPLSGVRIGLKDIYDLKGLKTSMGNRAWFKLYPPANKTAEAVQRLIDLGGIIVGKTRTSQFANGEAPTIDWVDYHDPFNPRGDGYGDPSSSSAGAGSAEASYDWIDMNIGSDTGGSVRAPAGLSGVFGNRPSQGALNTTGVLPLSPSMDTVAFVSRSADEFSRWGKAWYSANRMFKSYPSFPPRIIYPVDTRNINTTEYPSPGFFPTANKDAQPLYDSFVEALESLLDTTHTVFDFYTQYKLTSGTDLYPPDHVGEVWNKLTSYDQSRLVFPHFFSDYAERYNGDAPYLDPPIRRNYAYGLNQTEDDHLRIMQAKRVFQNWVRSRLLISDFDSTTCSNAIMVVPLVDGSPNSRETYGVDKPSGEDVYLGWNRYGISQLAGVPEVVFPIGSVEFESEITGTMKRRPVAVSLLAGYGCDFMLFDLVAKLAEIGAVPTSVRTGEEI